MYKIVSNEREVGLIKIKYFSKNRNYFYYFRFQDSEDDEEIRLAIQLSLGHKPKPASQNSKNSYLAAARKPALATKPMTSLVAKPTDGRNVFADPLKIVSAPTISSR